MTTQQELAIRKHGEQIKVIFGLNPEPGKVVVAFEWYGTKYKKYKIISEDQMEVTQNNEIPITLWCSKNGRGTSWKWIYQTDIAPEIGKDGN